MMRWLWSIFTAALRWLAARYEWRATPEGQIAAQKAREAADAAKVQGRVDEAQKAVRSGDADAVNKTLRDLGTLAVVLACLLAWGCASTKVVYIAQEDAVVRTVRDGKPGWFVPDATMARLLEKAIRAEEKKP